MEESYVVGLMSGTSLDGIDAALIKISKEEWLKVEQKEFLSISYSNEMRRELSEACDEKKGTVDKICRLNFELGKLLAEAVFKVLSRAGMKINDIDLIGSHGQTIYHDVSEPENISTLQIGAGGIIAELTGVTTVSNFRVRDVAAGGEGAPLVPYVDHLLYSSDKYNRVLQNIGGIGNYTYLPAGASIDAIEGSDTGPGNMLIDEVVWILSDGKMTFDQDGEWAKRGKVSYELLDLLMEHDFISRKAPKTTGREVFGRKYAREVLNKAKKYNLKDEDIVATVTAFTAYSIVDAYSRFIPGQIDQIILSGGGSYNGTLVEMIREYSKVFLSEDNPEVLIQEDLGYSSEAKEAVAFGVLAYQTIKGVPNNVPRVTGASKKVVLGDISPGRNFYL